MNVAWLLEQNFVSQFSCLLLTKLFVLRPVILLAFNTTVSNRFASGTYLQFDVIAFRNAAGSATQHRDGKVLV